MSILILAEHDGTKLSGATGCILSAAQKIGGALEILVVGHNVDAIAAEAGTLPGIAKILKADAAHLATPTPENVVGLLQTLASDRSHVLAVNTALGKSVIPRLAAV